MELSLYREQDGSGAPSLSVVVPICNEQDNIEPLHDALSRVLASLKQSCELIFVDDGSQDASFDRLCDLAHRDYRVKVLRLRRNFGQTAAMRAGIEHACGDTIITMDGDLQNDPADIPLLLAKLDEGYDLVYGWRKHRQDAWLSRKLPSQAANWLITKVTGFPAHDLGCSLKALRAEIAQELPLYGEMHRFIPILAHALGARCVEVVTRHHARRSGTTKYGIGRTVRVLLDLLTVKFMIRDFASPMKLFGRLGLWCGLAGLLAAGAAVLLWFWQPSGLLSVALAGCAGLGITSGLQLGTLGLLAEFCARTWFEGHSQAPYRIRQRLNFEGLSLRDADRAAKSRAA